MTPCFHVFEVCNRLEHIGPLSQVLNRLPCMSSNVSASTRGALIKSSGQLGDVDRFRELWKEMNARGLQPGPATFGCMAKAPVMNGQPDEALELIRSHADSEETRPSINTVTYTTVLKGFAMAERAKEVFSTYAEMKHRSIGLNRLTCLELGCAVLRIVLQNVTTPFTHGWVVRIVPPRTRHPKPILTSPSFCLR